MTIETLRIQYYDYLSRANRLRETMASQLVDLLSHDQITLGVPIESRVKSWNSIEEKIEQKRLSLESIDDLNDLIGVRLILLFRSDLVAVEKLVLDTFDVISSEDTAKRLGEAQFGYQSQHYVVRLPKSWLKIPSMADLGEFRVELQVRTLAQHIWAAASHKLQYKHEESVPPPLRRTINRVSALLETVDLEFDRILEERRDYREVGIPAAKDSEPLNVDLLASLLTDVFPQENLEDDDNYAELLTNMTQLSIMTVAELKALLQKHYDAVMDSEMKEVLIHTEEAEDGEYEDPDEERIARGVFFTHVGLAREALRKEFGSGVVEKILLSRHEGDPFEEV